MRVLPRRRKTVMTNLVLGVALLGAAAGAYAAVNSDDTAPATTSERTVTVTKGTVLATVSGSGSLASPSDAGANFTTGGTLTEVKVEPGDKVTKGQVLAKVDPSSAEQSLAEQEAALTAAEANLTKAEDGQAVSGSGGQTDPDPSPVTTVDPSAVAQAEAQVAQAENAVETAHQALDGTELTAPVSGTVASVEGAVGETVSGTSGSGSTSGSSSSSSATSTTTTATSAPTGFVVITNPTGMQVTANFSETDALKLKQGQAATVTLNADAEKILNAKVLSVSSLSTDSSTSSGGSGGSSGTAVQYAATLAIDGSTTGLRSGLSANVQVVTGEASDALHVTAAAVSGTGANRTVTVKNEDGTTEVVKVTVGLQGDTDDEITSGLTEGQQVQIESVASAGSGGFPGGTFPGGAGGAGGGGGGRGGAGGAGAAGGGGRG
ncbi:efflux RND transporter periplasmic adaptor subunit [Streptomyces sp. NPDC051217]|uniref:efflux RND transporter periplasmic adaptor subunit n=1 Tax=Streptomyces sp. NPDC051217 TaxID=3365644 RepID=UPI0037A40CB2